MGMDTGTRIYENSSDLTLESDDDLVLAPDDDVLIAEGSTVWSTFYGGERKLDVVGTISASHLHSSGRLTFPEPTDHRGDIIFTFSNIFIAG